MSDRDYMRELYPFLYAPGAGANGGSATLLASVRDSTLAKCAEVVALRTELLVEYAGRISEAAAAMAERFSAGATLFAFGNGGSATDADDAAIDCMAPPYPAWRSLPAVSLSSDSATVTALTNDVGAEAVFARQLGALARRGDIALGISTSGNSANVVAAFVAARKRGMLTVALVGYGGGEIAAAGSVDFCFVARREFVPRIQEGHATLWHALFTTVQGNLGTMTEGPG